MTDLFQIQCQSLRFQEMAYCQCLIFYNKPDQAPALTGFQKHISILTEGYTGLMQRFNQRYSKNFFLEYFL